MTILTPYTQKQYVEQLAKLFPSGKLWEGYTDSSTYQYKTLEGYATVFSEQDTNACELIDELFPSTSTNLLPIWQETVGLEAGTDSLQEQRNKVVAKLTQQGSLARSYYINYAKQLGYDIDIIEYSGIICGIYRCGDSVGTTDDYSYQFDITIVSSGSAANAPLSDALSYDGTNLEITPTAIRFPTLATTDPNTQGQLWNNGGTIGCSQSNNIPSVVDQSLTSNILYSTTESYVDFSGFTELFFPELPTQDPDLNGQLWNNGGVVCVSESSNALSLGDEQDLTETVIGRTWCAFQADKIFMPQIPKTDPQIKGELWSNGGILSISQLGKSNISNLSEYLDPILPAYITAYYLNN